jgi:hypothetical protein
MNPAAPWTHPAVAPYQGRVIASDPCVLPITGAHRMFYTDLGPTYRTVIALASSVDGKVWGPGTAIIPGRPGTAEAYAEGCCVFRVGSRFVLLYSTYAADTVLPGFPATLRAAISTNGLSFSRVVSGPALQPTPGWYDNDAIYCPTVLPLPTGGLCMLYAGHCYTDTSMTGGAGGVSVCGAFSSDGLVWIKMPWPVMRANPAIAWMSQGAAEPSLIRAPNGTYYLFFTGCGAGDLDRAIGMASASNPLGPWTVSPNPIITRQSAGLPVGSIVVAPHALLVNGVLRLWYTQVDPQGVFRVDYAESAWGL